MRYIDIRSDTVTQPTPAMREAMLRATVGDDCFGDDPTVNELEKEAARLLGKEAALFVTSGTQGNAVAIMAHTRRGDAIIAGRGCHILVHENGSYGMLAGVSPQIPQDEDGVMLPQSVKSLIRDDSDLHDPPTGLICLENAHSNGNVIPLENMQKIYRIGKERGVPVHMDGARLFNAAASLNRPVAELAACCDTVMCCLSKGLCAPVGSVVAGPKNVIQRARRARKILGGGLRQSGVLAAAGLVALREMTGRLQEDHDNARYLADGLRRLPGVVVPSYLPKINIVFFTVDWDDALVQSVQGKLLEQGIKIMSPSGKTFRMVTNHDVTRSDCDTVLAALKEILA